MAQKADVESAVVRFFLDSPAQNGIPLSALIERFGCGTVDVVMELLGLRRVTVTSVAYCGNPNIKRLPDPDVGAQQRMIVEEPPTDVCCYPSADLVKETIDIKAYDDRPFLKDLLLGEAQLSYVAFDLAVLD